MAYCVDDAAQPWYPFDLWADWTRRAPLLDNMVKTVGLRFWCPKVGVPPVIWDAAVSCSDPKLTADVGKYIDQRAG